MTALETQLQKYFSHTAFRPGQQEIVEAILAGKDVVALMPTGGGKSLCYQLPAMLSGKVSLVISPLIALMKDQVDALVARGIPATFINSSIEPYEVEDRLQAMREGRIKIVYVAPERLSMPSFRAQLAQVDVQLVAVDEAHCVSAWGHDFRPDYLLIHEFLRLCRERPVVAAFTATATPEVVGDIKERLELRDPGVFIRGFDRPNLKFFVRNGVAHKHRYREALRLIKAVRGAVVVYTLSRKEAEKLAEYFVLNGITAAAYHAGMSGFDRARIQDEFMENRFKVIVATVAFGMGVDKADIRLVLHVGMPSSLESYYQEAGRAGRDGEVAFCIALPAPKDANVHRYLIKKSGEEMASQGKDPADIERIIAAKLQRLERVQDYVAGVGCRRRKILTYFNDLDLAKYPEKCNGCDVCLTYVWKGTMHDRDEEEEPGHGELTATVRTTIGLYEQGHNPEQIARMRNLGVTTIWTHLLRWYVHGGNFPAEAYLTSADEALIYEAAAGIASTHHRLRAIKERLPDRISYEQIRLALAKQSRGIHT